MEPQMGSAREPTTGVLIHSSTTTRICKGTTRTGKGCQAAARSGNEYCWFHDPDPDVAKERQAARSAGGRARHGRRIGATNTGEPVTISSLTDVVSLLERTINDALSLENSLSRANTIARLAQVLCGIYQASEIEERIAQLERNQQQ